MIISAFSVAQTGKADFDFDKEVHKFGKVKEGLILEFDYNFINTGKEPLLISEIKVQCSCTTTEFPKQPIPPGQKATIRVKFNTKSKIGYQDRTLEIISNARKSPKIIRFKGVIDNSDKLIKD